LQFADKQAFGLGVHLLGKIQPAEDTFSGSDSNFLVRVLSLKNQSVLNLGEILFLCNVLKKFNNSAFNAIPDMIKDLKMTQKVAKKHQGLCIEYEFQLKELEGQKWELIVLFFKNLTTS